MNTDYSDHNKFTIHNDFLKKPIKLIGQMLNMDLKVILRVSDQDKGRHVTFTFLVYGIIPQKTYFFH